MSRRRHSFDMSGASVYSDERGTLLDPPVELCAEPITTSGSAIVELESGGEAPDDEGPDPDRSESTGACRPELASAARFGGGVLAATGIAAALQIVLASSAFASSETDVQMLQTAASIEALAVSTYSTALTLPFIGGVSANEVIKEFVTVTMQQHQEHLEAFNAAITGLGGKPQMSPDPALAKIVAAAMPGLVSPGSVVALALELEQGAAETYVVDVTTLSDANAKKLTASIMGVEAQHVSVLLAVQSLLEAGASQLIELSPQSASAFPAAAGSVGFPMAFFATDESRPAGEGASS